MASRIRKIVGDALRSFVTDETQRKAVDQGSIQIPRAPTQMGAAFGETISNEDITFAIKREPVAHRIVFAVAHDIYDNWFELEPLGEEEKKKDEKFNEKVQAELNKLNAKDVFTQAAILERAYGWSIIILGYQDAGRTLEDPVRNARAIVDLEAYGPTQISSVEVDKDPESARFGEPVIYEVTRGEGTTAKVHYTRVIHFATRKVEAGYKGISVLEPVWDDLTNLRNIRWGMGQTMYRYGSGFPVVTVEGATKQQLEDFERTWGPLTARTQMFKNEKQRIEFVGAQGVVLNPEPYYQPIMENISAGCGIPHAILRGAQAGALTGSEVNEREYFKLISDAQSRYEPGIRFLIDQLIEIGQVKTDVKHYSVNWVGAFEINPRDKAAADFDRNRSLMLKTNWLTINEVRAEEGLAAIPGGDMVLGLARIQARSAGEQQTADEAEANRPMSRRMQEIEEEFDKPIRDLLAERIRRGDSVSKICRDLGISTATWYDWARKFGLIS